MATAAGSEGDSVDLGAGLAEDSVGAEALGAAVAAEVGLLGGSFSHSTLPGEKPQYTAEKHPSNHPTHVVRYLQRTQK